MGRSDVNSLVKQVRIAELRVEILNRVNELTEVDPREAKEIVSVLASALGVSIRSTGDRQAGVSQESSLDRIISHFVSTGNTPLTKPQLVEKTGLSEGAIHGALYAEGKGRFEMKSNPQGGKHKVVSLTNVEYMSQLAKPSDS